MPNPKKAESPGQVDWGLLGHITPGIALPEGLKTKQPVQCMLTLVEN